MREARIRRDWVGGELAAMRVPNLELLAETPAAPTLREVAEKWRTSRLDVTARTATNHRVDLARILPVLGARDPAAITGADIAALVTGLHEKGLARETIRKTVKTLAMVFDFAGVVPNPARDRVVKLPVEDRAEVCPPTAKYVDAVIGILPRPYVLPAVVLDTTGMRVGELEGLVWGDLDEIDRRWRVSAGVAKTRRGRWVPVAPEVFAAVVALVPREDRDLEAQVFAGFGADRFRTAIARACKAAGVPVFSPHDLRHRRATLWHLGGVPAAEAAAWLGHSAPEHLRTYAHATLSDRSEIDVVNALERAGAAAVVHTRVHTQREKIRV
jgi:integrase